MTLRGVILAGGKGTRLGELTKVTNKHLLPVGPYPMVYHPLKKMVGAGVRDILLVSGTEHMGDFVELLGSGRDHNCGLTYRVQDEAGGIAQALGLAELHCRDARCLVLLGDNIFSDPLTGFLEAAARSPIGLGCCSNRFPIRNATAWQNCATAPSSESRRSRRKPRGDPAVAGIYLFPADVFEVISSLRPSARGELEITDVNNHYLRQGRLSHHMLEGYWTDAGTLESLAHANQLVHAQPPSW